ncbi:serine hydrolase domain-containing protein [Flagellimonas zhangzhouensis]|uniref:CubicO group peptidase, beta-lactamase class C family n=1 Tax=Flagellimonas zhangzhouensis TaxID=1073328 RepID=A0A1H2XWZ1_9FLAO|nr:serine hydrolase domain-containing protein [Allomuricauda zhangzhouensis]SDQ92758.1 CubicO group peptidase, beta-lactamase class C family [Allomuricauda zhangzhouensis]SDW97433.1 CubicO group peptidase, beta-lactamase class C family [Allomuricauda zhangzhouensis]
MKNSILPFFPVLLFFLSCGNSQINKTVNNQIIDNEIITLDQSKLIFEHTKVFPNNTQLALAFIENGSTKFYGVEKRNDSIFTVQNRNNAFEIGSITKVFTSTLLADFVIEDKLKLEDPINPYFDFGFNEEQEITFKTLANHTSGLPRMPSNFNFDISNQDPFSNYDEEKLNYYLANEMDLSFDEDGKYEYSNLGAGLLGYTLSKIGNKPLNQLFHERIFSKYKMSNSTIGSENVSVYLVQGQSPEGLPVQNWNLASLSGAGDIISTTEDLSRFVLAQFQEDDKVLTLTRSETHVMNTKSSIGLGWHIRKDPSGENWIWHNGGTGGYTSCMVLNTESKNGVIVLSNVSALGDPMVHIDELCFELMRNL